MARRRVDYDELRGIEKADPYITVEKNETPKAKTMEAKVPMAAVSAVGDRKIRLTIQEGIDMLAGYQIPDRAFIKFEEQSGECVFCGKKTNSPTRIICNDCDKKYIKQVYEALSKAVADGKESFTITY